MSKGTIIYVGGFEMPDKNAAAHRVMNNAKIFKKLGYDVVFCGVDKGITKNFITPQKLGSFANMPSQYPKNTIDWVKCMFSFSHIKNTFDCFDDVKCVIAYNMHAKPLSNLLKYCRKRKVKVLVDATEWYGNSFSLQPIRLIKWYDTRRVMINLQKKADGMIAISSYLKDYYKPFVKSIIQIPPLVDVNEDIWKMDPKNFSKTVEFTYTGVAGRDKDRLDFIVKCFSNIQQDFLFTVYGLTQEEFLHDYPELEGVLRTLGQKINFKGRVSHAESVMALKRADYCIFIRDKSRKNMAGFPTKFAECVTSGIGVIVNEFSDLSEYFPRDNCFLLKHQDENEIINAIKSAIYNGKIIHKMDHTFDYNSYIEKMNLFLSGIVDENESTAE